MGVALVMYDLMCQQLFLPVHDCGGTQGVKCEGLQPRHHSAHLVVPSKGMLENGCIIASQMHDCYRLSIVTR